MNFFSDAPYFYDIEIGWRFRQARWGRICKQSGAEICMQLEKQPEVKAISTTAVKENTASIRMMEKFGMQFIKNAIDEHSGMPVVLYSKKLTR